MAHARRHPLWLAAPLASLIGCAGVVTDTGVDGSTPVDAGTHPGSDAGAADSGSVGVDAGPGISCDEPDAGPRAFPGTSRDLRPGTTLASLLAASAPGDQILVHAGSYPGEQLTAAFSGDVAIEAAPGESSTFGFTTFSASSHLVLRGLSFPAGLELEGGGNFLLDGVTIDIRPPDGGTIDATALFLEGQHAPGPCHDVFVQHSTIAGGARTVFILGVFAPSMGWNHDLTFVDDDFVCGTHNCFQLSGGRDTLIERNSFHDPLGDGVDLDGATRVRILRNRLAGTASVTSAAIAIATPGHEWDNYAGVENMISSDVTVANNLITGWGGSGIELDAATNIRVVYNTVDGPVGFKTWARVPTAQNGAVILTGDSAVSLWNNILPTLQMDPNDAPLAENTANLIGTNPQYASTTTYQLGASSPAVGHAMIDALTPPLDLAGALRGSAPDIGALQHDGVPVCP